MLLPGFLLAQERRCAKHMRRMRRMPRPAIVNNKGSILLVVVVVQCVFALALFLAANLVLLDEMEAQYTVKAIEAFYVAEAGLACGVAYARQYDYASMVSLLVGEDGVGGGSHAADDGLLPLGPAVAYGDGSFSVRIADNPEPDKDPYSDTDHMFILSSTASLERRVRKTLWAVLRCPQECSVVSWLEPQQQ
jgi:hypothetical protein